MIFDLGGIACQLEAPRADVELSERYARYATATLPDLVCEARVEKGFACAVPGAVEYPRAWVVLEGGRYRVRRTDFDAELDLDTRQLRITCNGATHSIETPLRIAVAQLLPRLRGGLLLHSSGVVEGGRAFVFSGHSGAGKTTMVRLLSPRPPLGDDLIAVVATDAGYEARSTPFAGEYGVVAPLSAPLERLHFLEQAPAHQLVSLPAAAARMRILRNTLAYARDAITVGLLQDAAARLAAAVPAVDLRFRRDPDVARILWPPG